MIKTKLEKFIFKRMIVFFFVFALIDLLFIGRSLRVLIGLAVGGMLSIFRFYIMSNSISRLLHSGSSMIAVRGSIFIYMLNYMITLGVLALLVKKDLWIFMGALTGILSVPLIIFINGITEGIGLTKNNFE